MTIPKALLPLALILAAGCGPASATRRASPTEGMVFLPGGRFVMGTEDGFAHEGPPHPVTIGPFWLDRHEVTNDQFATFIAATGFVSEAERFGWSLVFDAGHQEFVRVDGADWRHPEGPGSSLAGRGREPVVQVSWNDATAYAAWAGKRLPTEAEFEYALRGGGTSDGPYPWGRDLAPGGRWRANTWQGEFPRADEGRDGHRRAAPVGSFPPGPFGLLDLAGNVWEWCADWYADDAYRSAPEADPRGPESGRERSLRGGSFLCSENYCMGYRVTARSGATPDSATNHMGFRCARSARGDDQGAFPRGDDGA